MISELMDLVRDAGNEYGTALSLYRPAKIPGTIMRRALLTMRCRPRWRGGSAQAWAIRSPIPGARHWMKAETAILAWNEAFLKILTIQRGAAVLQASISHRY